MVRILLMLTAQQKIQNFQHQVMQMGPREQCSLARDGCPVRLLISLSSLSVDINKYYGCDAVYLWIWLLGVVKFRKKQYLRQTILLIFLTVFTLMINKNFFTFSFEVQDLIINGLFWVFGYFFYLIAIWLITFLQQ